ncbi:Gfo/Idh/MocA family oxidoreductase [Kocuria kalidii]|uniref:Gfo/Idh/MocA family oxidoreductase n=1 Tax=Kocuria kalidii TaxID=3376283 RepID=UPI0037B67F78
MTDSIGIAVIGAGMAGQAHAAAYRVAPRLYDPVLPPLRYVAIGDVNETLGAHVARRYGYEKALGSWEEVAEDPEIDVVSVVIANRFHRRAVEGLLEAGKHVLCEKPLSDTLEDARAMARAAEAAESIARIGFTFRRTPGIAAIRDLIQDGTLGRVLHFSGRYWTDYGFNPKAPMSWRYQGGPGSGALADVGSHLAYVADLLCGDIASGAGSLEVSRVAAGHPNTLTFEVFCAKGAARFHQLRPAEIELFLHEGAEATNGHRTVNLGPGHAYLSQGLAMDAPGVGFGQNDAFGYQARAFLEEVAGLDESVSLPRNASFAEGVHNMEILAAAVESAASHGQKVVL